MIISFKYDGKQYLNFDTGSDEWRDLDISSEDKAVILNNIKWEDIRETRQRLIFETDWTQGQDSPLSPGIIADFATYRQALRDIPQNTANPDEVVWPDKPSLS
ncbi:tail fiber assembly protein [Photobacterium sp.]|uniref:tail fiber assembly protein n=1 Tax=Photobacterium sp. TaxID=660 RepID=UPI00299DA3F0|nr:tail fiber assembly protein [Photobacterium sp.]MDX1300889.1 tail fiber assembly protein [Photobacterium sp.]